MILFRFQTRHGSASRFAKIVSVGAMLLVGLLAYLGANPEAHEFFHKNSDQADHQCVVTHFAAGEGLYLSPQVVVAPKALAVQRVLVPRREVTVESFDDFLPPACGPPSAA